ncbi:unnamed protein product, partial [Iphiclides podalirius]
MLEHDISFGGMTIPTGGWKKAWYFLRTYILTIPRFDLFLQGALLIVILLESNVYLLLRRNAGTGFLRSVNEDWLRIGSAGAEFLFGAVLAWWGRTLRHLALSGWLGISAASGLIVLAFPYEESNPLVVELCGGGTISVYGVTVGVEDTYVAARDAFLVITAVLCALTRISIWAHGLTYLDDHEPQNGPYFYGILISIRLSLGLNGQSWLRPAAVQESWWHAHLSLCMLTLMFSVLFTLFPKRMPQLKEVDLEDDEETGLISSVCRLMRNKSLMTQTLALSFLYTGLFGFINYDNEFVQARYHIETLREDPRTTRAINDIFRSLVIIFFVSVFRVRFSMRRSDGVKANTASRVGGVVALFVCAFFVVLAAIGCATGRVAGIYDAYEQPACSAECGCNTAIYGFSPVCALETSTTYFSPCDAGCNQYEDLNGFVLFENCTCGVRGGRMTRGSCTVASCQSTYSFYLLFFALVLASSGASVVMQGMVVMRAVRRPDKPLALGLSCAIIALLAHLLGHLLYMLISYLSCAYYENGVCVFHHHTIWWMGATSAIFCLLSATMSLVASRIPPIPGVLLTVDHPS